MAGLLCLQRFASLLELYPVEACPNDEAHPSRGSPLWASGHKAG
jgi:hypothetical protein